MADGSQNDKLRCPVWGNCRFDPVEWGRVIQQVEDGKNERVEIWKKLWEVADCLNKVKIGQAIHNVKIVVITSALMLVLTVGIPYLLQQIER